MLYWLFITEKIVENIWTCAARKKRIILRWILHFANYLVKIDSREQVNKGHDEIR